ncbi:Metallo-dependent phosphatase-like protein [Ephemerocybe angulata]|uniref:Metallo-dependent phosphatase-like protein n=1 Tax=Ephemerocybe angulata TaxID=980116 RepID=A0A8H6M7U3_9AGAR|nr:Metallo-dependent phosphatase-like protein [Tulosesus angulatus]
MQSDSPDFSLDEGSEILDLNSADAIVHLEYTAATLPSLEDVAKANGGGQWTRFVCISDTHTRTYEVPDGDVLLHGGDLTKHGKESEMKTTMEWLYGMPHKVKVVIAGNHDLALHRDWYEEGWERWHSKEEDSAAVHDLVSGKKAQVSGIIYLENERATFQIAPDRRQWSVYGSPWSPEFFHWAFNYKRKEAEQIVSQYEKTDILMTHGPPHNILDLTTSSENAGCETLAAYLTLGRLRPRLHIFGHIHEAHGAHIHSWESDGRCEPLQVQNDINYPHHLTESDSEGEAKRIDKVRTVTEKCQARALEKNGDPELQRTVFVNAATYPQGRNVWKDGKRAGHGGARFRPVVVDLRD